MSFPSYERISDYVACRHYWMMCTRADWELGIRNAEWRNDKSGYTLYTLHYTTGREWGLHSTCQKSGELIHTFLNLSSLWALMSAACDETTPPLPFITFCHHPGPGSSGNHGSDSHPTISQQMLQKKHHKLFGQFFSNSLGRRPLASKLTAAQFEKEDIGPSITVWFN